MYDNNYHLSNICGVVSCLNIKVSLFNSTTDDVAIAIDLLRASTSIVVALNNFHSVIPVNNNDKAFEIKRNNNDVVLAGEKDLQNIEGYDITNSPAVIRKSNGNILVINTTNGTRILENIKKDHPDVKVLVGASINANALAEKALDIASDEIELVMAGRHETFNLEDSIGAGVIIQEILKVASNENIDITLDDSAIACKLLTDNIHNALDSIAFSWGGKRLAKLGLEEDVNICQEYNTIDFAPIYEEGIIHR